MPGWPAPLAQRRQVRPLLQCLGIATLMVALDAVAGRLLHAHPDPSPLILGYGAYLSVRALGSTPHAQVGATWGMTYAALHLALFRSAAGLLVGWNQSLPWVLTADVLNVAVISGIVGGILGSRAPRIPSIASSQSSAN